MYIIGWSFPQIVTSCPMSLHFGDWIQEVEGVGREERRGERREIDNGDKGGGLKGKVEGEGGGVSKRERKSERKRERERKRDRNFR